MGTIYYQSNQDVEFPLFSSFECIHIDWSSLLELFLWTGRICHFLTAGRYFLDGAVRILHFKVSWVGTQSQPEALSWLFSDVLSREYDVARSNTKTEKKHHHAYCGKAT